MLYISSSCVKAQTIKEAIVQLTAAGFRNIELSGGTRPYDQLEEDLLGFRDQGVQLLCHNYFPPPAENFVLNLASLNEDIHRRSVEHVQRALKISAMIGAKKYAVHAGFLIDIPLHQVGKKIESLPLFDRDKAWDRFISTVRSLRRQAGDLGIELYIENNVLSEANFGSFSKVNPFFICDRKNAEAFTAEISDVRILLDVAHLKVSSTTLGLDLENEFSYFAANTDYIHISDNDGRSDSNEELKADSSVYTMLQACDLKNKIITFEIYTGLDKLKVSYDLINALINE